MMFEIYAWQFGKVIFVNSNGKVFRNEKVDF